MTIKIKKLCPKLLFLLFFSLFFPLNSSKLTYIQAIEFDTSSNSATVNVTNATQIQQFRLDFSQGIPRSVNYICVKVKVTNNQPVPILYFSSTDDHCDFSRQQIVKSANSDYNILWLKVEEFIEGDLFVVVECLTDDGKTSYTLTFNGFSIIEMTSNFSYSYLVGSGNKNMNFCVNCSSENTDVLTFYAVGSKTVNISVDGMGKAYKWEQGSAITVKTNEVSSANYYLTVTASEGDYITVGVSNVFNSKTEGNLLRPNGNEISGYLIKDVLNDQCFEMNDLESLYKSQTLYITGRFYNHIAAVYLRDYNFKEINDSVVLVNDGYYTKVLNSTGKKYSVCVRFPDEQYDFLKNITFTLSVIEPTLNIKFNYYPPQVFGQIYRRFVPKNKIQSFGSLKPPVQKRITYK